MRLLALFLVLAGSVTAQVVTDGLVAWWSFDSAYQDRMGTHHGTASGTTIDPGKIGSAASVVTNDQYVVVADHNELSFGNGSTDTPFTIAMWVRLNAAITSANGIWLINKRTVSGGALAEWQLTLTPTRLFSVSLFSQAGVNTIGANNGTSLVVGQWRHIAVTYNGSSNTNGLAFFSNAESDSAGWQVVGSYVAMSNTTASVFAFRPGWTASTAFGGRVTLDDLRIYRRALSSGEIAAIYRSRQPIYGGE